jgi:hypothetical protein
MKHSTFDFSDFQWIESQTTPADRRALLSIKEALCAETGSYRYLEVGSHLGGSIQPHISDPRCLGIVSIDPRPLEQPDERWTTNYKYENNSTARMLKLLSAVPGADMGKIQTFEESTESMLPGSIAASADFAFIDGVHTNSAVLRDFHSVRKFLSVPSVLAFHDCFVTPKAFREIRQTLLRERASHQFIYFPESNVVSIVFGSKCFSGALLGLGWQAKFPISRSLEIRQYLSQRFPKALSILRRLRDRLARRHP